MKVIEREGLKEVRLPGRVIRSAVGKDAFSASGKMTMGFASYSARSGLMEPHRHAEEIVYVLRARKAVVKFGPSPGALNDSVPLRAGVTLHVPELEWHVFEWGRGGYLDIVFFYGQVDNIRPEDQTGKK